MQHDCGISSSVMTQGCTLILRVSQSSRSCQTYFDSRRHVNESGGRPERINMNTKKTVYAMQSRVSRDFRVTSERDEIRQCRNDKRNPSKKTWSSTRPPERAGSSTAYVFGYALSIDFFLGGEKYLIVFLRKTRWAHGDSANETKLL